MTCTCGDVMSVQANSREEAVTMLQGQMTQEALDTHMSEKHPGEPVPTLEETHAMIAQNTIQAETPQADTPVS